MDHIQIPPSVSLDAFELYHECVSRIGVFFLPLYTTRDLRIWCFDALQSQVPSSEIRRHKTDLFLLSEACQLPFPKWLKTAMRHNLGYTPIESELEQLYAAMAFRLGITIDSVRLLAV